MKSDVSDSHLFVGSGSFQNSLSTEFNKNINVYLSLSLFFSCLELDGPFQSKTCIFLESGKFLL